MNKKSINVALIGRLGSHVLNRKLSLATRLGYCELSTLAGMLFLDKDFTDFKDICSFHRIALDIFPYDVHS